MIHYLEGNALKPVGEGKKIIVHCCNDIGAWGSGFVVGLSKKWVQPEREYRAMSPSKRKLGNTQIVIVENNIMVANIIGQHDIKSNTYGVPPIRYEAVEVGLKTVAEFAKSNNMSIHMPRIGCFRAGGRWSVMENIIENTVGDVPTYVYDLSKNNENYNK